MDSLDISAILRALQVGQVREPPRPNNRAVKQYLLGKGILEQIAWSTSFNELCYWSEGDLDELFNELHLPLDTPPDGLTSFQIPPGASERLIKPSLRDIENSVERLGALCVDRQGRFCVNPAEGYAALSHVWSQGLGADDDNRGLRDSLLQQVFDRVEPLGVRWIWTDSLAIPGGKRALNLLEEELKGQLINAMASIYRKAQCVVVFDTLCLRLDSTDPVKVAAVLSLGKWMTRMWTYQEIKLATNAIIATRSGFVAFDTVRDSLHALAREEAGVDFDKDAPGKYPSLYRTFARLQRRDDLGVSLPDIAIGCGYRTAWDPLDYARAVFPTLELEWKTKYSFSKAMYTIYESQKRHASRLCLFHGPPRASLPGWAPASFNGLVDSVIIEPGIWKTRGMQRVWRTTKVKSILPSKPEALVLALESDFADQALSVGFVSEQTKKESPESLEIFKKAVKEGNAYLLANEPLIPKRHFSRVGLLVERRPNVENLEAWVCLTLAVGETQETYKAEERDWLLLHENPSSKEMHSGKDSTELHEMILNSALPDSNPNQTLFPLHAAAQYGNAEECQKLLATVDVTSVDSRGWTALHAAAASDQHHLFSLLIEAGAEIESYDINGNSPLILAVDNLHIDSVVELHNAGADVNASHEKGFSPICTAALKGNLEMASLLLALGADPVAIDRGGWSPVNFAILDKAENGRVLDALLEAAAEQAKPMVPSHMLYPIEVAARDGNSLAIRTLLDYGADPNLTSSGDPPLYHAIESGSADAVAMLIQGGAKCDVTFSSGWTAMMLAAKNGDHEVGKLIYEKNPSLNDANAEGLTPLQIARTYKSDVFAKWLLETGRKK